MTSGMTEISTVNCIMLIIVPIMKTVSFKKLYNDYFMYENLHMCKVLIIQSRCYNYIACRVVTIDFIFVGVSDFFTLNAAVRSRGVVNVLILVKLNLLHIIYTYYI